MIVNGNDIKLSEDLIDKLIESLTKRRYEISSYRQSVSTVERGRVAWQSDSIEVNS